MKIRFYPFMPVAASGTRITDADGNEYLDLIAAAGVAAAGYGHPHIRQAIVDQLDTLPTAMHCCHPTTPAVELAERLCALVPGDFPKKAWFGTTGSDANDCVFRLLPMATGRRRLISYVGSYHGQTTGSALLSGHQTQATVIGLGNVTKVPYPDPYRCMFGPCSRDGCSLRCLEYLERYALDTVSPADDTAGILIEAVQSDGGEIVPPANYLPALRELCDRHGIWLVLRRGEGRHGPHGPHVRLRALRHRPGRRHAREAARRRPAAVGGGRPARAARRPDLRPLHARRLAPPCAAGLAAVEVLEQERLLENATARGRQFLDGFEALQARHPLIGDVRGSGLIMGVELVKDRDTREPAPTDAHRLAYRLFELGLIVIYAGLHGNVIEMTPPLTITAAEVDEALALFEQALSDVEAGRFDDAKLAPYAGW